MKKLLLSFAIIISSVVSVFAADWGGIVKNETLFSTFKFDAFNVNQGDTVYLWTSAPLPKTIFTFDAEVLYKFSFDYKDDLKSNFIHVFDIDLLKVSGKKETENVIFNMDFGRFNVSDQTEVVFNQLFDGARVSMAFPVCVTNIYAGYTGFLNGLNTKMVSENANVYTSLYNFYSTAHKLFVVGGDFSFPYLISNQNIGLGAIYFYDADNAADVRTNRFYTDLAMNGNFTDNLSYDVKTIIEVVSKKIANYSSFSMAYSLDGIQIGAGIEYASGNNGVLVPFSTVTSRTKVNSFIYPETTGMLLPRIDFSLVGNKFYLDSNVKANFDFQTNTPKFSGIDVQGSFVYSLFTDLQIGLDVCTYFSAEEDADDNFAATLTAAFSF